MDVCLACGSSSVTKGDKRILYNPEAAHLVPVLRGLLSDFFNQEDIDRVLPHSPGKCTSSYVCRKCFRSLESHVKTIKTLQDNVLNAGNKLQLSRKPDLQSASESQPGKKTCS